MLVRNINLILKFFFNFLNLLCTKTILFRIFIAFFKLSYVQNYRLKSFILFYSCEIQYDLDKYYKNLEFYKVITKKNEKIYIKSCYFFVYKALKNFAVISKYMYKLLSKIFIR